MSKKNKHHKEDLKTVEEHIAEDHEEDVALLEEEPLVEENKAVFPHGAQTQPEMTQPALSETPIREAGDRVGPAHGFNLSTIGKEGAESGVEVNLTIEDLGGLLGDRGEELQAELEVLVREAIAELLDDNSVNLEEHLPGIAEGMIEAVKTGDEALIKELTAQLKAVGEISRLKSNKELRELFEVASAKIIEVAAAAARLSLQTALGALSAYEIRNIR